jgi:hypothetical protein
MRIIKTAAGLSAVAALAFSVAAPSAALASQQGRNTLLGGLAGAGAGALLTHSAGGALVGAAGGALIGNAVSNHHKHYGHYGRRDDHRHGRNYGYRR